MTKEHKNLLQYALEKWGKVSQVMMALEEMGELTNALLKNINRNKNNEQDILEEIGDVYIMLEQLKMIYNISEHELKELMDKKLDRLKNRLE